MLMEAGVTYKTNTSKQSRMEASESVTLVVLKIFYLSQHRLRSLWSAAWMQTDEVCDQDNKKVHINMYEELDKPMFKY